MPSQASPAEWGMRVEGSLDPMWPGQLRILPADPSRVHTNTCAVSPYPCDSTSGSRPAPKNSVQQDNHPRVQLLWALQR